MTAIPMISRTLAAALVGIMAIMAAVQAQPLPANFDWHQSSKLPDDAGVSNVHFIDLAHFARPGPRKVLVWVRELLTDTGRYSGKPLRSEGISRIEFDCEHHTMQLLWSVIWLDGQSMGEGPPTVIADREVMSGTMDEPDWRFACKL